MIETAIHPVPNAVRATGVGSLPGDDIDVALGLVFSELPDFPHLPELPARGPGADMVGRAAAVLVDMHVDLQPSGWRLVARPGMDVRRAREMLERDLDALVPVAASHDGPLKVQLAGPWTLAAALQTERGPALADAGAVADLAASYAEGVRAHLAEVRRRAPHAALVVQVDEPSLPSVLAGAVPTSSGLSRVRAVSEADAEQVLHAAVRHAGVPVVVHCCAVDVPVALIQRAGANAVSVDMAAARLDRDVLGAAVETGFALWAGVVPVLGPGAPPPPREVVEPVRRLWRDLGFPPELMAERLTVTPACGLAGASAGWARTAMRLVRQAAKVLTEEPARA
jgi:methionine synthase II (cobalamin-independent)